MDPVVQDILNSAMAEFAQHGLHGARVDAIAQRTRTSKRMLYYHFASKEGLYAAALAHAYERVRSAQPMPALAHLPALQALRVYVGHVFDMHVAHPQFVHMVMGENLLGGRFVRATPPIRQANLLGLEVLQHILERGQAEGTVDPALHLIDVYTNTVALAFHFVSNRPTFSAIFEQGLDPERVQAARRLAIIDTIERQVMARPLTPAPRGAVRARAGLAARQ